MKLIFKVLSRGNYRWSFVFFKERKKHRRKTLLIQYSYFRLSQRWMSGLVSSEACFLGLRIRGHLLVSSRGLPSVTVCVQISLYKVTSQTIGLGPTPVISFHLHYLLQEPISKYSPVLFRGTRGLGLLQGCLWWWHEKNGNFQTKPLALHSLLWV